MCWFVVPSLFFGFYPVFTLEYPHFLLPRRLRCAALAQKKGGFRERERERKKEGDSCKEKERDRSRRADENSLGAE